MGSTRLRCVGLIFAVQLLAVFAWAQQNLPLPGAPSHAVDPLSRLPKLLARTEHAPKAATDPASDYSESVLYTFCNSEDHVCGDGAGPVAGVIADAAGNLYSTVSVGGANNAGAVFELTPPSSPGGIWTETVLYSFCSVTVPKNCEDGYEPYAGLVMDSAGNLYGTTYGGGANDRGTVFELMPPPPAGGIWTEKVLYSFCSVSAYCLDGAEPVAGLVLDPAGNLYGTTEDGGSTVDSNAGTVFEVYATGGETVLYSFCSKFINSECYDGNLPVAGLIRDAAGNLYGTTEYGGETGAGGEVFKLAPPAAPGGTWNLTQLYSFCTNRGTSSCTDGSSPEAGLVQDAEGNLYGTTFAGGTNNGGTVFEVYAAGGEKVLYSFCSVGEFCTDGYEPQASLILDAAGNLYGTASVGGDNGEGSLYEDGEVFEVYATGGETDLYSFCSVVTATGYCSDGASPSAGLLLDAAGNLYGTTYMDGGNYGLGTVFELKPPPSGTTPQTISFPSLGPLTYGAVSTSLFASATSSLPVSFAVISGPATVIGNTLLTTTGAGTVTVQATQAGNSTYASAAPVNEVIDVDPASLSVAAGNAATEYGWPIPVLSGTLTGMVVGDGITASYTTTAVEGSPAGMYPITPMLNDPYVRLPNYNVSSTNGTLTIGTPATSVPLILALSQDTAMAGGGQFTLTVSGANFAANAVVLWNGAARATTDVSGTELTATILASDITLEGTDLVAVANLSPNAGTSAAQPFAVQSSTPVATITGASLTDTANGSGNYVLVLTGTDFIPGSVVDLDGVALATTYLSPWMITAVVPSSYTVLLPGTVTVVNSPYGTSNGFSIK
jgi:uncharacterized repeat protein (TIGR03803 family)